MPEVKQKTQDQMEVEQNSTYDSLAAEPKVKVKSTKVTKALKSTKKVEVDEVSQLPEEHTTEEHIQNLEAKVTKHEPVRQLSVDSDEKLSEPSESTEKVKVPKQKKNVEDFLVSNGRLKTLITASGIGGRISQDVYLTLNNSIKHFTEQKVKTLTVVDKKFVYHSHHETIAEKKYILPTNPFHEYLKHLIKNQHPETKTQTDLLKRIQYDVEQEAFKLCQQAQKIMLNAQRKTLFAKDFEVASKM
jgi:histone H3/H4